MPDRNINQVDLEKVVISANPSIEKLIPGQFEKAVPFNDPEL